MDVRFFGDDGRKSEDDDEREEEVDNNEMELEDDFGERDERFVGDGILRKTEIGADSRTALVMVVQS